MLNTVEHLLPEDFKESLHLLPEGKPVTLLTRHSIREQAENYNGHHALPLTEEGIQLAAYWGSLQPFERFQLHSSPVGRCIDTARHMFLGKHQQTLTPEVAVLPTLAEPGCFIENREVMRTVGEVFISEGPITFLNHMIDGKFDHLLSIKEGVAKLTRQFQHTHNKQADCLNIHVSHDTIVAAFVYSLTGKQQLEPRDWPRMMEGVYLWFEDNAIHGVWRGERFHSSLSHFQE